MDSMIRLGDANAKKSESTADKEKRGRFLFLFFRVAIMRIPGIAIASVGE